MSNEKEVISRSPEETASIGKEFANELKTSDVVGLFGNLGSGKTQFVKGVCSHFNVKDFINSPTFIILNEYKGVDKSNDVKVSINHFDLYRLENSNELKELGMESYVNEDSICLIEWAELADRFFQGNIKKVFFEYGSKENERLIKFS